MTCEREREREKARAAVAFFLASPLPKP